MGLLLAFYLPVAPQLETVQRQLVVWAGVPASESWFLLVLLNRLVELGGLLFVVTWWEGLPLRSVGLHKVSTLDVVLGLTLFLIVEWVSWHAGSIASNSLAKADAIGTSASGREAWVLTVPLWLRWCDVFVNGVAEELGCRGYAVERLEAVTNSGGVAALMALLGSVLLHIPFWGRSALPELAAAQFVFLLAYVWRRSLATNIIAHVLVDGLPNLWLFLPVSDTQLLTRLFSLG